MYPGRWLQVGSIRTTTSSSILKKNLGDASISLCAWILVGYAIANGEDKGRVAGGTYFAFWQGEGFRQVQAGEETSIVVKINSDSPIDSFYLCLSRRVLLYPLSSCRYALTSRFLRSGHIEHPDSGGKAPDSPAMIPVFAGQPFEATDDSDSGLLFLECVFRWSFAATCTTIVSGARGGSVVDAMLPAYHATTTCFGTRVSRVLSNALPCTHPPLGTAFAHRRLHKKSCMGTRRPDAIYKLP